MGYRFLWWFTGEVARYLVEEVEDAYGAVLRPGITWTFTAVFAVAAFEMPSLAGSALAGSLTALAGSLAIIQTLGSAWYFYAVYPEMPVLNEVNA